MDRVRAIVLPGMHGNALLLKEFQQRAPEHFDVRVHELLDSEWSYDQLLERMKPLVIDSKPCVLIAESFSGPLIVKLAADLPDVVTHLVLVATFVTPPTPWAAKCVPWPLLFRLPMPRSSAEFWMVGRGRSRQFIDHIRDAVGRTPPGRSQNVCGKQCKSMRPTSCRKSVAPCFTFKPSKIGWFRPTV